MTKGRSTQAPLGSGTSAQFPTVGSSTYTISQMQPKLLNQIT